MARPDLLRAVCHTASCVTKWVEQNDCDLYRLVCYIQTTLDYTQVCWVGDDQNDLSLAVWADADFAGDPRTQRSTSACATAIVGPHTRFFVSAKSQRQTAVSHSTPEAEIVSADMAVRTEALPASALWDHILQRTVEVRFLEDNEAVCKICKSGGSAKLMHMPRTHRVDAVWWQKLSRKGR